MVFMHIGTYIAVVSMAQDGQVIKKHVRPLETQLIEPPILGNDKLQIVLEAYHCMLSCPRHSVL